jgi:hypothetical protein
VIAHVTAKKTTAWTAEPVTFELRDARGEVIRRERRLLSGDDVLEFTDAAGAAELVIDPTLTRLQRDRRDDVATITRTP